VHDRSFQFSRTRFLPVSHQNLGRKQSNASSDVFTFLVREAPTTPRTRISVRVVTASCSRLIDLSDRSTGQDSATLSWAPPKDNGNTPITNYVVEYRPAGGFQWSVANLRKTVAQPSYMVTGLKEATQYEFRVSAENKVGQSAPSEVSAPAKYGKRSFIQLLDFLLICHGFETFLRINIIHG